MKYLLDTNACIALLNGSSSALITRFQTCSPRDIRLSAVALAELRYGARKSARIASNLAAIKRFAEPFEIVPFDDPCSEHYGVVRADLERAGTPIGPNDLLIAASALANDLVLVTHNVREFQRVPSLQIEDWERP